MTPWDLFWAQFAQLLVLFPAGASCLHTSGAFLKYPKKRVIAVASALFLAVAAGASWIRALWHIPMWIPACVAALTLLAVMRVLSVLDWPRLLAVYVGVLAIEMFPLQFAYSLDARLHPDSGAGDVSAAAAFFQLFLALALMAAFAYPASHGFADLLNDLDLPRFWYLTVALSLVFLTCNLLVTPISYATLRAGRLESIYPMLEGAAMAVLIAIYLLFYYGSHLVLEQMRLRERALIYEREARHYEALRDYLAETARMRHDFRHSARLLSSLAQKEDIEALREYLREYADVSFPESSETWCRNSALNALFAYYAQTARERSVSIDWKLELPDPLPFSEVDMSSLFGNLLENAVSGCLTLPADRRRCHLTCRTRPEGLYVVATNSFNGAVRRGPRGYLSTKREGTGAGLRSIVVIVERYGGYARFDNNSEEFWADVFLPSPSSSQGA